MPESSRLDSIDPRQSLASCLLKHRQPGNKSAGDGSRPLLLRVGGFPFCDAYVNSQETTPLGAAEAGNAAPALESNLLARRRQRQRSVAQSNLQFDHFVFETLGIDSYFVGSK
jgi:hypothetical protein